MPEIDPVLGFHRNDSIVVVEWRSPSLNAHNPGIARQGLADTRQGRILEGVNEHDGVTAVLVDLKSMPDGQITHYYALGPEGLVWHDVPERMELRPAAARIRNHLSPDGDPAAFRECELYNSYAVRRWLSTRPGVINVIGMLGLDDSQRIPGEVIVDTIGDDQIPEVPGANEVFIKPFDVSDVTEDDPNYRAQVLPNDPAEISWRIGVLGGRAILQPRVETMDAQQLLTAISASTEQPDLPKDALHTLRLYDFLWQDGLPAVAELRVTDPRTNIGKLYATHSELFAAQVAYDAFPELATLHNKVRRGLRRLFGTLGSLAMNYLILPDGSAKIVSIDARAFTPDLTDLNPERQALSRSLVEAEVAQLVAMARQNPRQALVRRFV